MVALAARFVERLPGFRDYWAPCFGVLGFACQASGF